MNSQDSEMTIWQRTREYGLVACSKCLKRRADGPEQCLTMRGPSVRAWQSTSRTRAASASRVSDSVPSLDVDQPIRVVRGLAQPPAVYLLN